MAAIGRMGNRHNTDLKTAMFTAVRRGARWLILLLALYVIALSLPRLEFWPDGWAIPVSGLIQEHVGVADEAVACVVFASLVLSYWATREGKESVADLVRIAGFLAGLPWAATLVDWVAKGVVIMFKTIRQRAMEIIREEAREEARAEVRAEARAQARAEEAAKWQAWLGRRVESNPDLLDENDPPPAPPAK